jgi:hypothetical protein
VAEGVPVIDQRPPRPQPHTAALLRRLMGEDPLSPQSREGERRSPPTKPPVIFSLATAFHNYADVPGSNDSISLAPEGHFSKNALYVQWPHSPNSPRFANQVSS